MYLDVLQQQRGGFNFDNCLRNEVLVKNKVVGPAQFTKTGTTIVGCVFKDGVVLAADTRATAGSVVADKNCEKLHYLAPNIRCAGAGTAADNEWVTKKMEKTLELIRLNTGRESRITTAVQRFQQQLFEYQGYIGAYLIVGGYDITGPQLASISANGFCIWVPYVTLGSGSVNAVSVLEAKYKDGLSEGEAIALCTEAIEAGILHDLGSGSNVDLCVLKKGKVDYLRNYKTVHSQRPGARFDYKFPKGNTPFLKQIEFKLEAVDNKDKME